MKKILLFADSKGKKGDIRDGIIHENTNLKTGLSVKYNYEAGKHITLSPTNDFGDKWFGIPCSKEYFDDMKIVFDLLQRNMGIKWSESTIDKVNDVYMPILNTFSKEIKRLVNNNGSIILQRLVKHLLGRDEFYKFTFDVEYELLKVSTNNFLSTENKKNREIINDYELVKVKLPTKIIHIEYAENAMNVSYNTIELSCNHGWQLCFRIDNDSSNIENSLNFEIKLIGVPAEFPTFGDII